MFGIIVLVDQFNEFIVILRIPSVGLGKIMNDRCSAARLNYYIARSTIAHDDATDIDFFGCVDSPLQNVLPSVHWPRAREQAIEAKPFYLLHDDPIDAEELCAFCPLGVEIIVLRDDADVGNELGDALPLEIGQPFEGSGLVFKVLEAIVL